MLLLCKLRKLSRMVKSKGLAAAEPLKPESDVLADLIVKGIQEKKGHEIVVMDLREINSSIADLFVVCHGDSDMQVNAIAHSIIDEVESVRNELPTYREGFENNEWVLLDYINVVVHIFRKEQRKFYGIEQFWADAKFKEIE
jgi:ribosome-associated protein